MNNDTLKKEVDQLRKELNELKNSIRQEIIAQQVNTRDPFRSDRGEIVLKKNFNLKSRKSLIPDVDNVTSMFFNEVSRTSTKNYLYLGHDGGNGQRFTNTISGVATDLIDLRLEDFNEGKGTPEDLSASILYATKIGNDRYAILSGNGNEGYAGIGTNKNGVIFSNFVSKDNTPRIDIINGKPLKVSVYSSSTDTSPTVYTGATGSFAVGLTTVTVNNGIITNIS